MQGRDGNRRARRRHGSVCSRRSESKRDGAAAGTRALRVLSEAVPVRLSGERGRGARSADALGEGLARDPERPRSRRFGGAGVRRLYRLRSLHAAHGERVRGLIVRGRRPVHLVLLDPGCAAGVRDHWTLPHGSRVEHITTYLARLLVAMPESERPPPLPETLVFHDPCALARGLRETIAPRALLAAAISAFREPPRCGVDTSCCGASGLLPRTLPDIARKVADDRRAELGGPAVTSSPACAAALGATEVVSVLARWLAQGTR